MAYERCEAGITCRGIRRAFRDELNSNPALVARLERAAGHRLVAAFEGAFMKNQGDDLRMIIVRANGEEDVIHMDVQIDSFSRQAGAFDRAHTPEVRLRRTGDHRRITLAPRLWFQDRGNAAKAENRVTFEALLTLASPVFEAALKDGIARAETTFEARLKPKRPAPSWLFKR